MTLVGASVISSYLNPEVQVQVQQQTEKNFPNISNAFGLDRIEKCEIDFGCNRGVCWRSCSMNVPGTKMWCYTSPMSREYKQCKDANDCQPCWECIEPCHK